MNKEQAIALNKSEFWVNMSYREIAEFQMSNELLCMPFDIFHEAMEKTLGRPVYTHEFAMNYNGLQEELFNGKAPPSLEDIINLIPEEKRILVVV